MTKKTVDCFKGILAKITPHLIKILRFLLFGASLFLYSMILVTLVREVCHAKEIYYSSAVENITISYGHPTIFRFNDEVKTISQASKFRIVPADKKNPNYSILAITPRFTSGGSKVTFILADGAVVNAKIVTLSKNTSGKIESFYDFMPKEKLITPQNSEGSTVTDLRLMKAMVKQERLKGYMSRSIARTIKTGKWGLSAELVYIYTGPKYNGYIFKVKNNTKKKYTVDLRNLTFGRPNIAILSQVDHKTLKKGKSTFLRIVTKPTSLQYNLTLPMGSIHKK